MSMYGEVYERVKPGKGLTKQSMRDECDVNLIMAKYVKTGFIDHVASGVPSFVDVSEMSDYRSALEHVREVGEYFDHMPAAVRKRFENDPAMFMAYLESGASDEDLEALGLEVLGDRRARAQDGREGDVRPIPDVVPDPEVTPDPDGTLPT